MKGFEEKNEKRERMLKFAEAYYLCIVNKFLKSEMGIFECTKMDVISHKLNIG